MSRKKYFIIIFIVIGIVSILFYKKFGTSICLFYNIYGIPCFTCGMTRAYIQLMKLNIKEAFYYHPLFWAAPLIAIFYVLDKKKYFYFLFILFAVVWLIRMYLYFPIKEPFNFNKNAILSKAVKLIF